ncbi:hypothetical protein GCM10008107_10440 [Psychrosphaera saromensis]|uniref:Phage abortive infection protein n=1 Tax=Psychrosphaera saromensis TaxID=716813 RepID=A0A2S7UWN3_9GAMM|nr:putative phage abortive infection protein [Psychrosphaera saromensis]PQJ53681.1 hypothetical protein BTO11_08370 [Psychrosphaera saromensis]GHB63256.1 hypothetical protein GCM10008107_10440 [Psychrosphaera saromensis]GLQ15547.1 hypothetical protein GCM10007917_30020 [Psychrosphaera saromensis]
MEVRKNKNENTFDKIARYVVPISAVFIVIVFIGFWYWAEITPDQIGQVGDLFGGLINPFLTFLTVLLLVYSVRFQVDELKETRSEISKSTLALESQDKNLSIQRFENSFFKLLEHFDNYRANIEFIKYGNVEYQGKQAVEHYYRSFQNTYLKVDVTKDDDSNPYQKRTIVIDDSTKSKEGLNTKYLNFYEDTFGEAFGGYFRILYNILEFVDSSVNIENKSFYTKLLRAQLSRYEVLIIFYNCLSSFGDEKLYPLVKKYKLLKHIETKFLPSEHIHFLKELE